VQSSLDSGHTHNIFFPFADLTNPPVGGETYLSYGGHVHTITLTQEQLTIINSGGIPAAALDSAGLRP
jgi:hypothetical protein